MILIVTWHLGVFPSSFTKHFPACANMHMNPLSYQPTLPADDVVWSKPSHPVSGLIPIPPRNEPHLSNSTVEIPRKNFPACANLHNLLSYQATLPADDVIWSKPSQPVSAMSHICRTLMSKFHIQSVPFLRQRPTVLMEESVS